MSTWKETLYTYVVRFVHTHVMGVSMDMYVIDHCVHLHVVPGSMHNRILKSIYMCVMENL